MTVAMPSPSESELDKTAVKTSSFSISLSSVIRTLAKAVALSGLNVTSTEVVV